LPNCSAVVIVDCDGQQHDKDGRHEQQFEFKPPNHDDGDDEGHQRIYDQHQAGAEHKVEHAHIVGGAGHYIADALPPVKGLALAQQTDIKLVAGIPLDTLGQELDGKVAEQPHNALSCRRRQHAQSQGQQRPGFPIGRGDEIESPPNKNVAVAIGEVVQRGGQNDQQREKRIAQQVRDEPAQRPGTVVVVFVFRSEFPFAQRFSFLTSAIAF